MNLYISFDIGLCPKHAIMCIKNILQTEFKFNEIFDSENKLSNNYNFASVDGDCYFIIKVDFTDYKLDFQYRSKSIINKLVAQKLLTKTGNLHVLYNNLEDIFNIIECLINRDMYKLKNLLNNSLNNSSIQTPSTKLEVYKEEIKTKKKKFSIKCDVDISVTVKKPKTKITLGGI